MDVAPCSALGCALQGVENDMAQLEEQAADHVEDPAGLTNKAPKDE